MSVRQLKENKRTRDGRSWVFIQYSKGLDGKRHQYQSQAYFTKEEATKAELEYLDKYKDVEVNPHMTFKEAYTLYNLKFDTCKKAKSLNPFIFKEFKTFLLFQKMRTIF